MDRTLLAWVGLGLALAAVFVGMELLGRSAEEPGQSVRSTLPSQSRGDSLGSSLADQTEGPPSATSAELDFVQVIGTAIYGVDFERDVFVRIEAGTEQVLGSTPDNLGQVVIAPSGEVALAQRTDPRAEEQAWQLVELASGRVISTLDSRIEAASFSADGQRLLYEYRSGDAHTLSVASRALTDWSALLDLPDRIRSLRWLPKESWALYIEERAEGDLLKLVAISSRRQETLGPIVGEPLISPTGESIAWWSEPADGDSLATEAHLLHLEGGQARQESLALPTVSAYAAWDETGKFLYAATPITAPRLLRVDPATKQAQEVMDEATVASQLLVADGVAIDRLLAVMDGKLVALVGRRLRTVSLPTP